MLKIESVNHIGIRIRDKETSAIFIRDPDRNVIELDAYGAGDSGDSGDYVNHP